MSGFQPLAGASGTETQSAAVLSIGASASAVDKANLTQLEEEEGEEVHYIDNFLFDPDLYGFAACALIRDTHLLVARKHSHRTAVRLTRLLFAMAMLVLNIFLQFYLISRCKQYITAGAVHDIREVYSAFEEDMYDEHSLTQTKNGLYRGHGVYNFHPDHFEELDESDKELVCQTPLSEPHFCAVILLIWTLSCAAELRKISDLFLNVIVGLPAVSSMEDAVVRMEEQANDHLVVGITRVVRVRLVVFILLPRLAITLILTWLGSRWLLATNNFGNLVLNSVALTFILGLKDLLYDTVVPERNKRDVSTTQISPPYGREAATIRQYVAAAFWLPLSAAWVFLYMYHLQTVIPQYQWDVNAVCQGWIEERFAA